MTLQGESHFLTNLFSRGFASLSVPDFVLAAGYLRRTVSNANLRQLRNNQVCDSAERVTCSTEYSHTDGHIVAAAGAETGSSQAHLVQVLGGLKMRVRDSLRKVFRRSGDDRAGSHERLHKDLKTKEGLVSFPRFEEQDSFGPN